jgi:hypothetical protein
MHQMIPLKKQRRTKEYFGFALAHNSDNGMKFLKLCITTAEDFWLSEGLTSSVPSTQSNNKSTHVNKKKKKEKRKAATKSQESRYFFRNQVFRTRNHKLIACINCENFLASPAIMHFLPLLIHFVPDG